jgi:hypothetical protein
MQKSASDMRCNGRWSKLLYNIVHTPSNQTCTVQHQVRIKHQVVALRVASTYTDLLPITYGVALQVLERIAQLHLGKHDIVAVTTGSWPSRGVQLHRINVTQVLCRVCLARSRCTIKNTGKFTGEMSLP